MTVYNTDREILDKAKKWLQEGYQLALVTVAKTWGSSPRPRGSMLLMRKDGIHFGSVSGGCVEADLVERYRLGELTDQYPNRVDYGVDRQDALRFGLPCGGRLELVVEELHSSKPIELLLNKLDEAQLVARRLCLNTGEVSLHAAESAAEFAYTDSEMIKVFGPAWHLLLIGAGQLSRYVANFAQTLDYRVTVCDPREEYQAVWSLEGTQLSTIMPDDAVAKLRAYERSIVIALTHDPKLDDMALMEALCREYFYVGALGSKRSSEQRRERLIQLGITESQLEKLHAPVGLAIGSHTPAEIAIAIMADLTAARNGVSLVQVNGNDAAST